MIPTPIEREARLQEFAAETQHILVGIERWSLALAERPDDPEVVRKLADAVRSVQRSAARAGFEPACDLTRDLARLLERLGTCAAPVAPKQVSVILLAVETVAELANDAVGGGRAPRTAVDALCVRLVRATWRTRTDDPFRSAGAGNDSVDVALRWCERTTVDS